VWQQRSHQRQKLELADAVLRERQGSSAWSLFLSL
ncbi:MAG: hypothetical protein ACI8UP_002402, partial [Porticoccaceae bacterium]